MEDEILKFILKSSRPLTGTIGAGTLERPAWMSEIDNATTFLDLLDRLSVTVPVLSRLRAQGWSSHLPEEVSLSIAEKSERAKFLQSVLISEYESVAELLVVSNINPMVVGGYDYSYRFYTHPDGRQISLVDFLILPEEYSTALRVLGRSGYRVSETSPNPVSGDVILVNASGPNPIRIRRVLKEFGPVEGSIHEMERLWQRSFEGRLPEMPRSIKVLSSEDAFEQLLRLAAQQKLYASPNVLNDLHYVIRHLVTTGTFGSEAILDRLAKSKMLSAAYFMLNVLAEEWGTPVPKSFLESAEARLSFIGKRISRRLKTREGFLFSTDLRNIRWHARIEYLARQSAWDMLKKGMKDTFSLSNPDVSAQRIPYIGSI